MYQLIITEKPNAAKKIADALADGKPIKKNINKVPYYEITRGKTDIVVTSAVGHLYGLKQKGDKKWVFPMFDIEWVPSSEMSKKSDFSKKYLNVIKKLAKGANDFVVATDYDIEGEVIGLNVVRYACKQKDAKRMKFSTLTKGDLIESYDNMSEHLDWGQANAGETRHMMDWFWGINTSRALTAAIKTAGMFKIMSTGRVQGPALKIVVDREKEIKAFKPVPFWQIELLGDVNKGHVDAWHKEDKFWEKDKADNVMKKVKGAKEAVVDNVDKKKFNQAPPHPFDLTSLQIEAHKCVHISPKETLSIAQELYTGGYISYPRTSSQQLTPKIGYKKILAGLSNKYKKECDILLAKSTLKPNDGKKSDPAHPAIYPTGSIPNLEGRELKIYELIVRRFLATFGDPATRETVKININCKDEIFIAKGTTTVEPGWHILYGQFAMFKDEELPIVEKGDKVNVKKIEMFDKETQPPKRYTESSIIKALESKNLGTKATRASIVDTLFQRGYVDGKSITATELGIRTCETLEKYSPLILDEELTREFELDMEKIREGAKKEDQVIEEAKKVVLKIIDKFKKHEKEVGKELLNANVETRNVMTYVGKCHACDTGELQIRKGRFGQFVACNKYPDCKTTFSLPKAIIKPGKKDCEKCGFPIVLVIKARKRPQEVCINPKCETKQLTGEAAKEAKAVESGKVHKKCPKCGKDMILRSSLYGKFWGCSGYPKCRGIEKIAQEEKEEDTESKDSEPQPKVEESEKKDAEPEKKEKSKSSKKKKS